MTEKRVELLAPAGNYQALVGALNAGADAVYVGGDKYSARAYADNFTQEELLKALRYAHICGKKLYLTLNTLIKEKEFSGVYDYVKPLYEAGLDGIIIQDLGIWKYIREVFIDLPLHASTQMTITGVMGAKLLQEAGAARIVPARELSLNEIRYIKEKTGLEIECFIHGAMCYSYSGQCLFSSILGGRSGNRGRCAQPCRLPYRVSSPEEETSSEEIYPLSLKDMCTIEYIPRLIEAGIDSFKIEGRMKKPEYAAGVTEIYRKYIDRYYEGGQKSYKVDKSDMDRLYRLYIRSEVQTGYYERYNGRDMITIGKGGYLGSDENLLKEILDNYLKKEKKNPVKINAVFKAGERSKLVMESADADISAVVYGQTVQRADNRPMTEEDILKQLKKTGNSSVYVLNADITVGENVFIPVAQLNELRRKAVTEFENKLIEANGFAYFDRKTASVNKKTVVKKLSRFEKPELHVTISSIEQLLAVIKYRCGRIYIDCDLYVGMTDQVSQLMDKTADNIFYLALPYVLREKDADYLKYVTDRLDNGHIRFKGFLVRNLEELYWVHNLSCKNNYKYDIVIDSGIYCFNAEAVSFINGETAACEFYVPWELNSKEQGHLIESLDDGAGEAEIKFSLPVYGTIPMMITANCVKKTTGRCAKDVSAGAFLDASSKIMFLTDRYNAKFPVMCNCRHCYNIIYNSLPYSLHNELDEVKRAGFFAIRLDFIFENDKQVSEILDYYTGKSKNFPLCRYTTGHYKRGVE